MKKYIDFIKQKQFKIHSSGFECGELSPILFDYQRDLVRWALKMGKCALFTMTGTGKTLMQLEWAKRVNEKTGGNVLIVAPLAVSSQTIREGKKLDMDIRYCKTQEDVKSGISITNYERLEKFTPDKWTGIVLDESSILKSFTSSTRDMIVNNFRHTTYKLACTATPAPNDFMELGNHAEFLNVMTRTEMLSMFFVHDGGDTAKWRLKGHAEDKFWQWCASWAAILNKPSDLGYDDTRFNLPPLNIHNVMVSSEAAGDFLFAMEAKTLDERRGARKSSFEDRVKICADLVNDTAEPFLVWCDLNIESEALRKSIKGGVELKGSDTPEYKEKALLWFIGEENSCQLNTKNIKLSTWTPTHIGKNTISGTGISDSCNLKNISDRIEMRESNICVNGIQKIKTECEDITSQIEIKKMNGGETDTIQTQNIENHKRENPGNIQGMEKENIQDLNPNLVSQSSCICPCSKFKAADVPYVGANTGIPEDTNSTLTIATKQEKSEDFSAHHAISESENLKTHWNCLKKQDCIYSKHHHKKVLISKPSIAGMGLNFQHCNKMAFVGLSDSFEQYFQAVRRCWRFGQKKPVDVYVITSEAEGAVVQNIKRKENDAMKMILNMVEHTRAYVKENVKSGVVMDKSYCPTESIKIPEWLKTEKGE